MGRMVASRILRVKVWYLGLGYLGEERFFWPIWAVRGASDLCPAFEPQR